MDISKPEDLEVVNAWQRVQRAACRVSVAQPHQIGEAVAELMDAKREMDGALVKAVNPQ